ncbi:MAG TPA: hypothetical protein VFR24_16325 [Candidatus Angelobacter sp.]|jgi:hypothetical protein|nr:hypothetical protein [Candidatus Angelobacter sp.]
MIVSADPFKQTHQQIAAIGSGRDYFARKSQCAYLACEELPLRQARSIFRQASAYAPLGAELIPEKSAGHHRKGRRKLFQTTSIKLGKQANNCEFVVPLPV